MQESNEKCRMTVEENEPVNGFVKSEDMYEIIRAMAVLMVGFMSPEKKSEEMANAIKTLDAAKEGGKL